MQRLIALGALLALPLGACSPSDGFWDRSPGVASARAEPAPPTPIRQANRPRQAPRRRRAPRRAPRPAPRYTPPVQQPAPRYTPPAPIAPTPPVATQQGGCADDWQTLAHVNEIRRKRGLRAFTYNAQLFTAAFDHSAEQRRYNYMGHGSPVRGRNELSARMRLAGYHGKAFAEVVAKGYRTVPGVVRGWMNSPGHRDILLDPKLSEASFSRIGDIWTGNFGTPYPQRSAPRAAPRRSQPYSLPRGYTTPRRPAARPTPTPRSMPRFSPPAPSKPSVSPPPAELIQRAPPPPPPPSYSPPRRAAPAPSAGMG